MAKDGDRHLLGDPISRVVEDGTATHGVLTDTTDPALLTEGELRRQLANLEELKHEAPLRGTPPDITHQAELRLRQLNIEHRRRVALQW